VMSFEPEKITKMEIKMAKAKVTLQKSKEGKWNIAEPKKLPEGFEFDESQVQRQLTWLKNMQANKVELGYFVPTGQSILLSDEQGKVFSFHLGKEDKKDQAVAVQGNIDSGIYMIPAHQVQRLEKGVDLFKKSKAPAMPQGLENLPPEMQRQLMEQMMRQQG